MTTPPPPRYPIVYTHCFSRTAPSLQAPSFHDHSTGYPPPLSTKSSAAATASRRSLCHCSFVVYIALPPFLQRDPLSLVLQPTVSACHLAVSFLFCAENPAASPSCMRQGFPQTNFRVFLTPSAAPRPQSPLTCRRFCPGNFPLPQSPFFPECSRYMVVLPDPLTTHFRPSKKTKFAVAYAAISFFWCSEALSQAILHNPSLLDTPREKKNCVLNKFPIRVKRETITDLSHHRRR